MKKYKKTIMTLESEYGKISIEVPHRNMDIDTMWDELIRPLLLAAGYHPDTIDRLLRGDDEII